MDWQKDQRRRKKKIWNTESSANAIGSFSAANKIGLLKKTKLAVFNLLFTFGSQTRNV